VKKKGKKMEEVKIKKIMVIKNKNSKYNRKKISSLKVLDSFL
jgi:hypothetical protein